MATMTDLDEVISKAFVSSGKQEDVNKVYLALLRTRLFLPVKKEATPPANPSDEQEPFVPCLRK